MRNRLLIILALTFSVSAFAATTIPNRSGNTGQALGFRVKGTNLTTTKGSPDLSASLSLLPTKNGRPTLIELKTMTITFDNSFAFNSTVDSKGRVTGAFTAKLLNDGHLAVKFLNFNVTGILGVSTATPDGQFMTPQIAITLTATTDGVTPITLLNVTNFVVTYNVVHGVATAAIRHAKQCRRTKAIQPIPQLKQSASSEKHNQFETEFRRDTHGRDAHATTTGGGGGQVCRRGSRSFASCSSRR